MFLSSKFRVVLCLDSKPLYYGYFGLGTGDISYNFILCLGREAKLDYCFLRNIRSCNHNEDVGVKCEGNLYNLFAFSTLIMKFMFNRQLRNW